MTTETSREAPRELGLVRTSFLSAVATAARLASGFVVNKMLAIYVGAGGIASVGQFQSLLAISTTLGSCAIQTGVVKYAAEFAEDVEQSRKLYSTSLRMILAACAVVATVIALCSLPIAEKLLGDRALWPSVTALAGALVCFALSGWVLAILNGRREIRTFVTSQLVGSAFSVALSAILPRYFGTAGALAAIVGTQVLVFAVTMRALTRRSWFSTNLFTSRLDPVMARRLGGYTLMAVTSALAVPTSQVVVRTIIGRHVSWEAVGYWQGVMRISDAYLMLITTTLSVYYLPRLSALRDALDVHREIWSTLRVAVPLSAALALFVYLLRVPVIKLLYTDSFMGMEPLFGWQLFGDVARIAAWVLGNVMQAKAMTRRFIVTEVVFGALVVALSAVLVPRFGAIGATQAFALAYSLYLVVLLWLFRDMLRRPKVGGV